MIFNTAPNPKALKELPDILKTEGNNQYERLKSKLDPKLFAVFDERAEFKTVLALSDFIANTIFSYPKECAALVLAGALDDREFSRNPKAAVDDYIKAGLSDFELKKRLRIMRRSRLMALAWRDLIGSADIEEIFLGLSTLAEALVLRTLKVVRASLNQAYGDALDKAGNSMPLLVLGMGKLGGGEINFSSDIDLIFAYPEEGDTKGASRSLSHREFFSRIIQRAANFLSDKTVDTFCYRIDLRLRPFGDAGTIVNSFESMAIYYETQGRTWERYALVKAKLLGDKSNYGDYGQELIDLLRPFVYRRYLDYGAVQSLRKLKHMIEAEVRRRRLGNNFKLGEGGIREIEFIAQVFELMRGGRFVELRERSLRKTLSILADMELLPPQVSAMLDVCYCYLRRLENVIQEFSDKQTQCLPENPKDFARMLYAMNYEKADSFMDDFREIMRAVHNEFRKVVADEPENDGQSVSESFDLWEGNFNENELALELTPKLRDPSSAKALAQAVINLKNTLNKMPVGPVGRETLLQLMPKVIRLIASEHQPESLFKKVAGLIEHVALRTTYMQLLSDNNMVLQRFISLIKENAFASELITAHPILLDELFIPQYFKAPPKPQEFFSMLQERLLRIEDQDLEELMEELRLFKKIMVFRIAMSDKAGFLPLMKVSDALTWLAEAIIRKLLLLSWEQTAQKYGVPHGHSANNPGLAIIGYGKLGGIELGYKSDLDMVFIREVNDTMTEGDNSVPCSMFYQRLVQRFLHLATTRTVGGVLYDLDMRLRPDGDTGLLISDIDSFEQYQKQRAWIWEHQALVRARPIAGSKSVIDNFERVRNEVLRHHVDDDKLKSEVINMRLKMKKHLDRGNDKLFDLKQSPGGMIDIEFIAQYLLLKEAPKHQDMVLWTDNIRIFDECSRLGVLSLKTAETLKQAYIDIRVIYNQVSLEDKPRIVAIEDRPKASFEVERIWKEIF